MQLRSTANLANREGPPYDRAMGRDHAMTALLRRITVDPGVCHGKPCIKGTRIMVWQVVQFLANGDSVDDILSAHADLTRDDVRTCLAYAAELTRERILPRPSGS
jgi:uncharacterized protein (DUF433 family)